MSKRVALVTGGMGGLGTAICRALAEDGFVVVANCLPGFSQIEDWLAQNRSAGFEFHAAEGNVADYASCNEMVKRIEAEIGPVDVLVNNAGITRDALLLRMKESDWDLVLSVNLKGSFLCTKAVVRHMAQQRSGRIINVASVVGVVGNAGQANYVASKAGLIGLTKTVAREFAGRGITVNAVAPGFIETQMTAVLGDKIKEGFLAQIPMGRAGSPEDVAGAVTFLASDQAAYLTGQVLHVSGGMYM